MSQILFELDNAEETEVRNTLNALHEDIIFVDAKRFDGALALQILATLNAVTIPILSKIVIERIRSNRHVVIKKKGIVI